MKITPTYLREEEDEEEDRVRFPLRPRPSARPRQPHHRGGCGVEHRFKLLINLHRDGDDGGGKEGRDPDGEIAPRAIERAARPPKEWSTTYIKNTLLVSLDFPAVFRAVAHMQRAYLGKVGCRLSMRVQKGWVSHGQPNFD